MQITTGAVGGSLWAVFRLGASMMVKFANSGAFDCLAGLSSTPFDSAGLLAGVVAAAAALTLNGMTDCARNRGYFKSWSRTGKLRRLCKHKSMARTKLSIVLWVIARFVFSDMPRQYHWSDPKVLRENLTSAKAETRQLTNLFVTRVVVL